MEFRYLHDPLFLLSVTAYALNRYVCKPFFPNVFSEQYANDVLCIPFWVPIMLFLLRKLGLRVDDRPPTSDEILIPLTVWAVVFELYLPHTEWLSGVAFSDHVDILCYAVGACVGGFFWHIWYRQYQLCG